MNVLCPPLCSTPNPALAKGPKFRMKAKPQMPVWAGSAPLSWGAGQEESGFPSGLDFSAAGNSINRSLHNSLSPEVKTFRKRKLKSFHRVHSPTPGIKHLNPGIVFISSTLVPPWLSAGWGIQHCKKSGFALMSALMVLGAEMLCCSLWFRGNF